MQELNIQKTHMTAHLSKDVKKILGKAVLISKPALFDWNHMHSSCLAETRGFMIESVHRQVWPYLRTIAQLLPRCAELADD